MDVRIECILREHGKTLVSIGKHVDMLEKCIDGLRNSACLANDPNGELISYISSIEEEMLGLKCEIKDATISQEESLARLWKNEFK